MTDRQMDRRDRLQYIRLFMSKRENTIIVVVQFIESNYRNLNYGHDHGLSTVLRPLPGIVC